MHNKEQITKEAVIEPTRIHMLSNEATNSFITAELI